ncbi:thiol reductant ABC exporter subunit CydC [Saccharibacter sp. 17.LH.SD]|uniref:thiol reductant ABC exporter subunit CydC n=1 Tax=Saccharibacter sp. 17.LH.SD TaxID=2689393 RepID=UPI00137080E3|nr:thiol reductant ABC exporter subunit CydC [Saccharibacter sp. 17.LH.SD]MXV43571.1 thiol reductant ABC exporter subunit CydC [Saccharibacter sp. 17.LH.SD]
MKALVKLSLVWRSRFGYLLFGLLLAELSVCSLFLLMGQTGGRLSSAIIGVALGFGLLRIAGVARIVLRYLERLVAHDATFKALTDLRVWFYRRLSEGAAAGLGFRRSGDLLSRLVSDIQSLDNLYLRILIPLAAAFISLPILVIICLHAGVGGALTLTIALLFALIAFLLPYLTARSTYRLGPDLQQAQARLQIKALDMATGLREMRIFGAEERMCQALEDDQETLYLLQKQQGRRMAALHASALLLSRLGGIAVLCACVGIFYHKPDIIAGVTIFFVVTSALDMINDLPRAGLLAGQACHAAERVASVVTERPLPGGYINTLPEYFDIQCHQLSFGWPGKGLILEDASFFLKSGEKAILLGPSGSGKSSLAALLLRVVSPRSGYITLDGINIEDVRDETLRNKVAWLSQNSHLFDDTIRHNLLLGREGIADDALWDALEKAQIADFVRSLPDGLDHWIGENGSHLSGGQGRRIALARVLLSSAPVLILDEPAAGLDLETEKAFLETINRIDRRRSVLLITHRLTGVERPDHIWRLEKKKIVAQPI